MPGDHWGVMLEHVCDLAAELSSCLLKANGGDDSAASQ
jgi:hypothetical protein